MFKLAGFVLGALVAWSSVAANAAELSAYEILARSNTRPTGEQGVVNMHMVMTSASGDKKERDLLLKTLTTPDTSYTLIQFQKPADLKGTAFLAKVKKGEIPDQYVYLPAAKLLRRVAAGQATSSFFGSDFSNGDMVPYVPKKDEADYARMPDEKFKGQDVYVLQLTPKAKGAPYGRVDIYIDKVNFVTLQVKFFDTSLKQIKEMFVNKLKKMDGKLVPVDIEMRTLQSNTKTQLIFEPIKGHAKLTVNDFSEEAMKR